MNIANNLNIESLQDTYYANIKDNSWNAGLSYSNSGNTGKPQTSNKNSFGISGGGSSTKSNTDSQWVNNQTSIIANNNINITTNNNTDIKGGLIASNSDNLTLNTNSLTYSDITNFNNTTTKGSGLDTGIGTSSDSFFKGISPSGTTSITHINEGEEKEGITRATIGNGNITIGGQTQSEDSSLLSGLNRDVNNSQEITKDMITGALDGSVTIDNRLLTSEGRSSIAKDFKNLGSNTLKATIGALGTTSTILGSVLPSAKQTIFVRNEDGTYTVEPIFPEGPLGTALKYGGAIWTSPNTLIGLTAGVLGIPFGAKIGFDSKNLVFPVTNYPIGNGAVTLGSTIIYSDDVNYNTKTSSYDGTKPIIIGPHEYGHVKQASILGPFYLPVYLLSGGISKNNWMEKQADKKGNEAYKNKYGVRK